MKSLVRWADDADGSQIKILYMIWQILKIGRKQEHTRGGQLAIFQCIVLAGR